MHSRKLVWLGALALTVSAAACGSSTAPPAGSSGTATLTFTRNGTPDLKGLTIRIGNAAGSAHIGDTNVHDLVQILNQWGANATQQNASQNAPELAVDSGKLDIAIGPLPTEVDAGLTVFGPNQARLDDEILAKPGISSLAGLRGKTVAMCCDASPDGVLLSAALAKAGLSQSQLSIVRTGASSSSLNALVAGQVDAAFTAASGLPASAGKYRVLGTATQLVPAYADSFMAAQGSWLKSHPGVAEAVDLAWLAAAKLFSTDEAAWVKNAAAYTSNADTTAQYSQAWQQLRTLNGWPLAESTLTPSVVTYNLGIAGKQNALQGQGNRPAAQEMDITPWQQAWSAFSQHQGAY
jgi:ABC-type nitrate/sulfonate/bicarbonate transport system substrate-binding protein